MNSENKAKHTFIIAEAGVNHNGDVEIAKKMVDEAKKAGVDAVKFQTFKAENLVASSAPQAKYQKKNIGKEQSQLEMLKKLELKTEEYEKLAYYCSEKGIEFMSTPFDEESADFLEGLNMIKFKIPSGEVTNLPLIRHIGLKKKPIIFSTGMASMDEVKEAVITLQEAGTDDITVLHCTSCYPAPLEYVNLKAMTTMERELGLPVGYSDHTEGIEISIAATAMGAVVIEKHFTLDRNMDGPDHMASIEPDILAELVRSVRNVDQALGNGVKEITQIEMDVRDVARKSVVAAKSIDEGSILTLEHIMLKRPGTGIPPKDIGKVVGKRVKRSIDTDTIISYEDLEV